MAENKALNQKIKIIAQKRSHQINSSAANPHNTHLDEKEANLLKLMTQESQEINIWDNVLEWYIRTLGDELYKLAFINKEKFYRIKVFWPSDYEVYLNNQNTIQQENNKQYQGKQLDNVTYYLKQFEKFEIEDYFDVIIFPRIDKQGQKLTLSFLVNPFTYLLPEKNDLQDKNYSQIEGLELFFKNEEKNCEKKNFDILCELTNLILSKYVIRQEIKQEKISIDTNQLRTRIVPIIEEETRVFLYELYQDL